ncbi:MAG TPA: hypothetical protein VEU33_13100 [Archangium sp.]|nr:hypothetical protein [Archangium sp.]
MEGIELEGIEQVKESESSESGYTGCSRLKRLKTILMIVTKVAMDGWVGEKMERGMGRATQDVLNVNF